MWTRRLISGTDRLIGAALLLIVLCQVFIGLAPRTGELRVARELTGSMRPTIQVGAMILYRPSAADALTRGEVISFHMPGKLDLVTHRVISVQRHGRTVFLRTRGDANNTADRLTSTFGSQQTVWHVVAVTPPWVATIVFDLADNGWRLMLSLVPLMLALAWAGSRMREPEVMVAPPTPDTGALRRWSRRWST